METPPDAQKRIAQLETELRQCRAKLKESEAHFHSVFEGMGEGLLMTDLADVVHYANGRMAEMCGYARDEMIGRPAYELFLPREEWPTLSGHNERRAQGHSDVYETELLRKDGSRFWGLIHATPLRDANGKVVGTIGAQIDITTRKWAEEALKESEERFRQLVEQAVDAVMVHDQNGRMLMANAQLCRSLGYGRAEILRLSVPDFEMNFTSEDVGPAWQMLIQSGAPMTVDGRHRRKDGSEFPVEVRVGLVSWKGQQAMIAIARDVTRRKADEAAMNAALREKDVMLQEIHHRVKNNLQIICSLLNLQAEGVTDAKTRAAFEESRGRVRSMALIHEKLYQTDDLANINMADYLDSLTASLARSAGGDGRVRVELQADAVTLDIDRAVPCGLIVNELVTNAYKYAFPDGSSGTIGVELRESSGQLRLRVCDDGVGLPPDLDIEESESIGLQLVTGLTQQLEGTIKATSEAGTCWTLCFGGA